MGIQHKFLNIITPPNNWTTWPTGFNTEDCILQTPYKPDVLFIGTFNPATHGTHNPAEFFYGRNGLWPTLEAIFNVQGYGNQSPKFNIGKLCNKLRLSFADLIQEFPDPTITILPNSNKALYNGEKYNLFTDKDLLKLDSKTPANWSTQHIITFINNNPSIRYVYLTNISGNKFQQKFEEIQTRCIRKGISFRQLYTPSMQGLPGCPNELFLALQWLIEQIYIGNKKKQFARGLDKNWLYQHNIHQFNFLPYQLKF